MSQIKEFLLTLFPCHEQDLLVDMNLSFPFLYCKTIFDVWCATHKNSIHQSLYAFMLCYLLACSGSSN